MDPSIPIPCKDEISDNIEDFSDDATALGRKWSKQNIYEIMKSSPDRLSFVEYESALLRSDVWSKFKLVQIDGKPINFAKCNDCIALFHWYAKLGTTSLLRHRCATSEARVNQINMDCNGVGQRSMINDQRSTLMTPIIVPPSAVSALNDSIVVGLARDLQPLRTVESKGFLTICQTMVTFGSQYGNQDVTKFIKSKRDMKNTHLIKMAKSVRDDLKTKITEVSNFPRFSFTFDLWTETRKQRDLLLFKCHFINSKFELQSSLMGVQELPIDLIKTSMDMREPCKKFLDLYFAENLVEKIMIDSIIVSDGKLSPIGMFPTRLPCMWHQLNLVLDDTFSETNLQFHPEIKLALSALKALVTYFKESGLNSKLTNKLKQTISTCWNSDVIMIESYIKSSCEVQAILVEAKQIQRISALDETVLIDLLKVINPFKLASEEFCGENLTVDKVVPTFFLLTKYLEVNKNDSEIIINLKLRMKESFIKFYTLENIHIAATALNPSFKSLKLVSTDQKETAYRFIRDKLVEFGKKANSATVGSLDYNVSGNLEPTPPKLPKTGPSLSDLEDSDDELDNPVVDELTTYLQARRSKHEDSPVSALKYWENATEFSNLREIALWLLAIPASSIPDERTYSGSGLNEIEKSRFGGNAVQDVIMIHKNFIG